MGLPRLCWRNIANLRSSFTAVFEGAGCEARRTRLHSSGGWGDSALSGLTRYYCFAPFGGNSSEGDKLPQQPSTSPSFIQSVFTHKEDQSSGVYLQT